MSPSQLIDELARSNRNLPHGHALTDFPSHGRIECTRCYPGVERVTFDSTRRTQGNWRITANPMAWGSQEPEIVVLGFSKGPTQSGALATARHDDVAYKGSRQNVGKILQHVGLLSVRPNESLSDAVSRVIADRSGRFHFGSLIRCTVEREEKDEWKGSGGGMLDKFVATQFGVEIAKNCMARFLTTLPRKTKLIVMFGMGSNLNYVDESFKLFRSVLGGKWERASRVAYTDANVTVVHVEHFASQGNLIPRWLGLGAHCRSELGAEAIEAVKKALNGRLAGQG